MCLHFINHPDELFSLKYFNLIENRNGSVELTSNNCMPSGNLLHNTGKTYKTCNSFYDKVRLYSMSRKKCHSNYFWKYTKTTKKNWMLCSDAWENLHKTHTCLGQWLGVSAQLKKFKNLFRGHTVLYTVFPSLTMEDVSFIHALNTFWHPKSPKQKSEFPGT